MCYGEVREGNVVRGNIWEEMRARERRESNWETVVASSERLLWRERERERERERRGYQSFGGNLFPFCLFLNLFFSFWIK